MTQTVGLFAGGCAMLVGCFIVLGVIGAMRAPHPDFTDCVAGAWLAAYGLAIASGGVALMLRIAAYV